MSNDIIDVEVNEVPDEEQIKKELNHPNFKKWFAGLLKETEVNLKFLKANGEMREMRCSLNEDFIPEDKRPKDSGRKQPEDSIAVFDIEKQDWRSFRFDSIKEFDWELPDDSEYPSAPMPVFFDENGNEINEIEEEQNDGR
jgi:hypothetical protein